MQRRSKVGAAMVGLSTRHRNGSGIQRGFEHGMDDIETRS
jgi:hypothetical protein